MGVSRMSARIPTLSPSGFKTLKGCERAWWYAYVGDKRSQGSAATRLGSATHEVVEVYLRSGEFPEGVEEHHNRAKRAQHILDDLRGREEIAFEKSVLVPLPDVEANFRGVVDFVSYSGSSPLIVDHKTTQRKYWLEEFELVCDPQLVSYAWALFPNHDTVTIGHLYLPDDNHEPKLVTATVDKPTRDAMAAEFAKAAKRSIELRAITDPEKVPAKKDYCWMYGGCYHASYCSAAPLKLVSRIWAAQQNQPEVEKEKTINAPEELAMLTKKWMLVDTVAVGIDAPSIDLLVQDLIDTNPECQKSIAKFLDGASHWSLASYGRGPGVFATVVGLLLDMGLANPVKMPSHHPAFALCMPLFEKAGYTVFRGVR